MNGNSPLPLPTEDFPRLSRSIPRLDITRVEPLPNLTALSPQERRIVALFALEYTNKEVARELGIHPETVKTYSRRIYAKLGVRSKAGCVVMAYRHLSE